MLPRGLARRLLRIRYPARPGRLNLQWLGSPYGGWVIPVDQIAPEWICYCAGVGEDVTFDLELIARWGCTVFAFDPTPRSKDFVRRTVPDERRFRFFDWGLWSHDDDLRFYAPRDPTTVSHSIVNLQNTTDFFVARVRSVLSIMKELGHDRVDLLKLDVEGAEYAVLSAMLSDNVLPGVLCVEFDQPVPLRRTMGAIRLLQRAGYRLAHAARWNHTFVRQDLMM